jgi:hypothetical protein
MLDDLMPHDQMLPGWPAIRGRTDENYCHRFSGMTKIDLAVFIKAGMCRPNFYIFNRASLSLD